MKDFVLYFPSYLSVIQIQLNSLDNLIRKWFWKWLKKKYASKPKLLTFLHDNFLNFNKSFFAEKKVLIPLSKINNHQSMISMVPSQKLLIKNVFLSSEEYNKFKLFKF
jgi:hypothetical protein